MKRLVIVVALLVLAGCWRTTIRNGGTPIGQTPIEYDNLWHNGLIYGIAELSGPYDLQKVCPQGWSEIHTETDFLAGLVTALTFNIYTPQRVTVRCAAGGPR
jgi:hypothetical protein